VWKPQTCRPLQARQDGLEEAQGVLGPVGRAFLEVAFAAEFVGEVREADDVVASGGGEGVEGGGFHLDGEYAGGAMALDVLNRNERGAREADVRLSSRIGDDGADHVNRLSQTTQYRRLDGGHQFQDGQERPRGVAKLPS
jgi:hypothetical protein